jgi:subtilisin family serine protease
VQRLRRHSAISRAVADGAKVINMSLGDTVYSQSLADAVEAAWSAGVVIVAGAGNDGVTAPFYPAALEHVIAVGAFDESTSGRRSRTTELGGYRRARQQHPLDVSAEQVRESRRAGRDRLLRLAERHVDGDAARRRRRRAHLVARRRDEQRPGGRSAAEQRRSLGRVERAPRSWTTHGGLNLHDALSDGLATGKPVANAGPDQTVTDADGDGSALVSLDGSASHDDNGTLVAYEWREGDAALGPARCSAVRCRSARTP